MTRDMQHVTHDMQYVTHDVTHTALRTLSQNVLSKFQPSSSYGLGETVFKDISTKDE